MHTYTITIHLLKHTHTYVHTNAHLLYTCTLVCESPVKTAIEKLPSRPSSRVLLAAWLLAGLILSSAYRGVLTSLLAVPRVTVPVDSLEDLVSYGKIPWANEKGTSLHQLFGVRPPTWVSRRRCFFLSFFSNSSLPCPPPPSLTGTTPDPSLLPPLPFFKYCILLTC